MELKKSLKNSKEVLEKVLSFYGATIKTKGNCDCTPSRHKNPKGDLSIKKMDGYVCCCHCGLSGDVFNVVNIMEGITSFPNQVKRVCEIIGMDPTEYKDDASTYNNINYKNYKKKGLKKEYDFTKIANDLHKNINKTDYFKERGFSSKIIEKYKLGYQTHGLNYIIKNYPGVLEEKENDFYSSYKFFIPNLDEFGRCNYLLVRREDNIPIPDWVTNKNIKVHNLKGYSSSIFNMRYLRRESLTCEYIFVVEGWADALSLEELGYNAIALNSTSNVNLFLKEVKNNKKNLNKKSFIIIGDKDVAGQKMVKNLRERLKIENVKFTIFDVKKCKYNDINDWLVADRDNLSIELKTFLQKYNSSIKNNHKKIHVEKYISNNKNAVKSILNSVKNNKKILINGAMGIGKTHFIRTDLLNYAKSIGKKIIIVIPGVAQLENLKENKGLPVVYGDISYYNTNIVAVTPDSLLTKVVSKLKFQDYILVIDEAHQKVLDYSFRRAFKNIDVAEKTAYKIIYMTATPRVIENEKFDYILKITTNNSIENRLSIVAIDNKNKLNLSDVKLTIIKENLKKFDNVIFFQNNKKINEDMANLLAEGQNITKKIYKDNYQYSICLQSNSKGYVEKTTWQWITKTQTIQSGKENKEAKKGLITANVSFVTSVITAGIDLRVPKGNKALLIIDATKRIDIDSIVQLIGRFREGINVIILVKPSCKKNKYNSFKNILKNRMHISKQIADIYNKNKVKIEHYENDICINCLKFDEEKNLYEVDNLAVTEKAYRLWNNNLIYNINKLTYFLKKQTAFTVIGEIEIYNWQEKDIKLEEKMQKLKTTRKEEFKKVKEKILNLDNETLLAIITKKYDKLDKSQVDVVKKYYTLRPNSHSKKLNEVGKLFIDEKEQVVDVVKAFKYFYSKSWSEIQNELDKTDARLINLDFRINGIEPFLDKRLYKVRTQKRQRQAKIRWELKVVEKKQGRVSKKIINIITKKMIKEGYFRNKNSKIYLDSTKNENDRLEAFNKTKESVLNIIKCTYNITKDGRISSVKY